MNGLLGAVSLLTRVPTGGRGDPARAVGWLPLVGAAVGAVVGGVYAATRTALSPLVAAGVAVTIGVVVTGALHEDGLGDCADAFGARVDADETLRILADPRLGTFGVVAVCASILVRVAAVAALSAGAAVLALVASHALGRSAAAAVMLTGRPARGGLGAVHAPRPSAWAGVAVGAVLAAIAIGGWSGPAIVVGVLVVAMSSTLARRRIGGYTGDVLGATEQVTEVGVLVVALLAARWPLSGLVSVA